MSRKWTFITNVAMIIYAIISIISLITKGWIIPDGLLFAINLVNFLLFQFAITNKYLTLSVIVFTGLMSLFVLAGFIAYYGLLFAIYGIILIILFAKNYD